VAPDGSAGKQVLKGRDWVIVKSCVIAATIILIISWAFSLFCYYHTTNATTTTPTTLHRYFEGPSRPAHPHGALDKYHATGTTLRGGIKGGVLLLDQARSDSNTFFPFSSLSWAAD